MALSGERNVTANSQQDHDDDDHDVAVEYDDEEESNDDSSHQEDHNATTAANRRRLAQASDDVERRQRTAAHHLRMRVLGQVWRLQDNESNRFEWMRPRHLLNHQYIYDFNVFAVGGPDDDESDARSSSDDERIPDLDESLLPILIPRPVELVDDDDDDDSLPGLVPRASLFGPMGYYHDLHWTSVSTNPSLHMPSRRAGAPRLNLEMVSPIPGLQPSSGRAT